MDNLFAVLIVTLAVAYLVRTFYKRWKEPQDCGCGCSSCDIEMTCDDPNKGESPRPSSGTPDRFQDRY